MTASQEHRSPAAPIQLLGGPKSPEATELVDSIVDQHILPRLHTSQVDDERKAPRASSEAKVRVAVGALLADLIALHSRTKAGPKLAGLHGRSPKDFQAKVLGFGRPIFLRATEHMQESGLLDVRIGRPRWQPAFGTFIVRGGDMTAYSLTEKCLELAQKSGVLDDWAAHWTLVGDCPSPATATEPVLTLRATRRRIAGQKTEAEDLPIDYEDPRVQKLIAGVHSLNAFLAGKVEGIAFLGLRRIFNDGDVEGYAWNKHGRYYLLPGGHNYLGMGPEWRRSAIVLEGEPVDEVDLRASHLTLLHALLRHPFNTERDPYDFHPDYPRAVVKAWITQALGSGKSRLRQWSQSAKEAYERERPWSSLQDEFPIREVGAAVKNQHPLLVDLETCSLGPNDLMYHEAEIVRIAMEDLMLTQGIPVLPVHDALIAPRSAVHRAKEALKKAFASYVSTVTGHPCLVSPRVTLKSTKGAK